MLKKARSEFYLTCLMICLSCIVRAHGIQQTKSGSLPTYNKDTAIVNQMLLKAQGLYKNAQLKETISLAEKARTLSKLVHYNHGISISFAIEGKTLYRESKYQESMNCMNASLALAKEERDSITQSTCLNLLGNSYASLGNYPKALEYFQNGLSIEEKIKVQNNLHWFYNNIGNIYNQQNQFTKALEYFHKAIGFEKKINNQLALALTTSNIGGIYADLKNNDSALHYFTLSLKSSELTKDSFSIASSCASIAVLYTKLKQYDKAIAYSMKTYQISKKHGFTDMYATNLLTLSEICTALKEYDPAARYLEESLVISKSMQSKYNIRETFHNFNQLYETKKDYKKAYDYYKLYSEYKDSMLNTDNSRIITEMNTKYTTEKKQKEIELLKKNEDIQSLELSRKKNELNNQRAISIAIFSGLVLLMAVAILLFSRYRLKKKANDQLQQAFNLIEEKNVLIEKSNHLITDSITYAKRIQDAILPAPEELNTILSNDFFIIYKPAQIVSGDFYWCSARRDKTIFVVADCTGHGVPGAFMSMIGNTLLNEIVNEQKITCTKEIAEMLDKKIIHALHQHTGSDQYDGMDISICCIDKTKQELSFTGAHHAMYTYTGGLQKIKGDPYSIGGAQHQNIKLFSAQKLAYQKGQRFYFLTDGYCDQNGGSANKRFTSAQFEKLLVSIQALPMEEQQIKLETVFEEWKGSFKQRDDILVAGIQC